MSVLLVSEQLAHAQLADIVKGVSSATTCLIDCTAAGVKSITDGTNNENQGQQTQNMAQMAMGAMQIAQGLLGLLAAASAGQQAGKGNQNGSNMGDLGTNAASYPGFNGTSPTPTNTSGSSTPGTSNSGDLTASAAQIGVSPSDLRSGVIGKAMDAIEKNHGIPRDKFLDALKAGINPKDLIAAAPKNAPPMDMLDKIADGLAARNAESASRMLASGALAPTGGVGTAPTPATGETEVAKGTKAPASIAPADDIETDPSLNDANVSPEVKAALAARAEAKRAERELRDSANWNLFQLVHNRYRKLETMLYGRVERTNPVPGRN